MPSSATITTTDFRIFSPNTTIYSSQVNGNFNIWRGHVLPLQTGSTSGADATLSFDLGSSDYKWRYFYGSPLGTVKSTSGSFSMLKTDTYAICDATSGAVTVTLPTATGLGGKELFIKKTSSNSNAVILSPSNSETIDATTTVSITSLNDGVRLVSDNTNWKKVSSGGAGGGAGAAPLRWYSGDASGPTKQIASNGMEYWDFSVNEAQILYAKFTVPNSYIAGTQCFLKNGKAFSSVTSGNFLFRVTSYIFKADISGTATPTGYTSTNSQQAINGTTLLMKVIDNIDISSSTGTINSVAIAAGNTILLKIVRDIATETSGVAGDVSLDADSFELVIT